MSSNPKKEALVFFSAGVGDAILLVPLVNELRKQNYRVTGLFNSPFQCESIFENTDLFNAIVIKENKFFLLLYCLLHFKKYDKVFLNHFSFSKSHISLATLLSNNVCTNYISNSSLPKSVNVVAPVANTHDALQNVFLHEQAFNLIGLNFTLNYKPQHSNQFKLPAKYLILQVSSANNKAPYKNWPLNNWLQLFKHLQTTLPATQLVVLGDESEVSLNEKLKEAGIISLIGKTTLSDVMEIIFHSQFYIGLDSGLMHMAVALNKPTFTMWGASNPILYGYEWMNQNHKVVSLYLPCAPCSAWINPNTSRVKAPLTCPDFKCIRTLPVEKVIAELNTFIKNIGVS